MAETRIDELTGYGLTRLEARVYVYLVKVGKSSASQVARGTGIVRTEVYRMVRELVKKEIVAEHLGRPIKFEAISPDKMLQRMTKHFEKKVEALRRKQQDLYKWLTSIQCDDDEEEPSIERFQVIRGQQGCIEKFIEMFRVANEEIIFFVNRRFVLGLQINFDREVLRTLRRGVRVRGITEINSGKRDLLPFSRFQNTSRLIEVKHNASVTVNYLIKDGKEMIFSPGVIENAAGNFLWTNSRAFIHSIKESFELNWVTSQPIHERLRALRARVTDDDLDSYRSFVQKFHGIVYRSDLNFLPVFFYGALKDITGYTADEFFAKKSKWSKVIHPDDFPKVSRDMEKLSSIPGYFTQRDYRIIRKDGKICWISEAIQNICDEKGKPSLIQGTLYDITERKQAEEALRESERKYRTLYETIKDGIVSTTPPLPVGEGRIVECNQAYADMLGYSKEEVKSLTLYQLTPNKWHQMEADIFERQVMSRGYSDEYEKEYVRKDGTVFPISIRVWFVRDEDGKPKGMWAIVRDITERKQAEEKLKEY